MIKSSLLTFIQVCECGSFTKASAKLFITPSAIMQQMDSLEKEYGVQLLKRSKHGVHPTKAGQYLLGEAITMCNRSTQVLSRLSEIAEEDRVIYVGTSLFERCRLLYDLWSLFTQKQPGCSIQMVNNTQDRVIPEHVDFIESLNSGIPWMQEWNFLEICQVPFGIAMEKTHPLASNDTLSLDNLSGQSIVTFRYTSNEVLPQLYQALGQAGADISFQEYPTSSVFWQCAFQHRLLLAPLCWSDILANMTLKSVTWPYTLPYGIFYRKHPTEEAALFIDFVKQVYYGDNPDDLIPILSY